MPFELAGIAQRTFFRFRRAAKFGAFGHAFAPRVSRFRRRRAAFSGSAYGRARRVREKRRFHFSARRKQSRFSQNGAPCWTIDVRHFAGSPQLFVEKPNKNKRSYKIELRGARFPDPISAPISSRACSEKTAIGRSICALRSALFKRKPISCVGCTAKKARARLLTSARRKRLWHR